MHAQKSGDVHSRTLLAADIPAEQRHIGRRIADRRRELGLTIEDVADRIGLAPASIKSIENGKSARMYCQLAEIAEALHTTPNDLLDISAEPSELLESVRRTVAFVLARYTSDEDARWWAQAIVAIVQQPRPASVQVSAPDAAVLRLEMLPDAPRRKK